MCLSKWFTGTVERPSPSDIVPEGSIKVVDNNIIVDLARLNIPLENPPKVWIPPIPDTNSMDGAFDYGNNNILIAGADEQDHGRIVNFLKVGDVAVYRTPNSYIIHRIVKISSDSQGRFFKFKGDNNASEDPDKVRDSQIEWLSVGAIY